MVTALRAYAGWYLLPVIVSCFSGCTPIVFSSPEGTITTYVKDSGVQVYAPRAARAQKVVFDTADQQLIQKPDTAFRKFFDSHSIDFASGKVEYAKTTILGDVVNMVRNREFIRDMIKEVVDAHRDSAIAPNTKLTTQLKDADQAIQQLAGARSMISLGKTEELLSLAHETTAQVIEASLALCWSFAVLVEDCKQRYVSAGSSGDSNVNDKLKSLSDAVTQLSGENKQAKALTELVQALRSLLMNKEAHAHYPLSWHLEGEDLKKLRERNATLLVNTLFFKLVSADYPDMRSEQIQDLIRNFVENDGVWAETTVHLIFPGGDQYKRMTPAQALWQDLTEALEEQRYFRVVIDKAVEKRQDLFRQSGSPIEGVRQAQGTLTRFVKDNIGEHLLPALMNGQTSLWNAFLDLKNGTSATPGVFVTPETGAPLTQAQLRSVGEQLRQRLTKTALFNQNLETGMYDALGSFEPYLRPGNPGARGDQTDSDLTKTRELWSQALLKVEDLKTAFSNLKDKAALVVTATQPRKTAQDELDKAKQQLQQRAYEATGVLGTVVEVQSKQLEGATQSLQQLKDKLTSSASVEAVIADPARYAPIEQASALHELGKSAAACGTSPRNSCPGEANSQWDQILQSREKLVKALELLGNDVLLSTNLAEAAKDFLNSPAKSSRAIIDASNTGRYELKPDKLEQLAEGLERPLGDLAKVWIDYFKNVAPDTEKGKQAKRLADNLESSKGLYKQQTEKAKQPYSKVPSELAKDEVRSKMDVIQDAELERKKAQSSYDEIDKRYRQVLGAYEQAESSTVPGAASFLPVLKKAVETINPKMEQGNRIHSDQVVERTKESLKPWREGSGISSIESLDSLLNGTLKTVVRPSVIASRNLIAKDFAAIFAGQAQLIQSDEPMLQAFINGGAIKFGSDEQNLKAARDVQQVFQTLLKESRQGAVAGGSNDTTKKEPSLEQVLTILERSVERPEVSYLFGSGATNMAVIDAFKKEFYNAFRHRVPEAVAEERDADYSYWWLTFYPKAIPLGDNALEGQSTIEVGFQQSVTPEEQYHRWIQDHIASEAIPKGGVEVLTGQSRQQFTRSDKSDEDKLPLQLATSVLNDFMVVLDSSTLIQKHQGMRELLLEALERFGKTTDKSPQISLVQTPQQGNDSKENPYVDGRCYLYEKALEALSGSGYVFAPGDDAVKQQRRPPRPFVLYLASFHLDKECRFNSTENAPWKELQKQLEQYLQLDANSGGGRFYGDLLKAVVGHARSENVLADSLAGMKVRARLRSLVKNDLAWDEFGPQHVLFAVTSAVDTGIALPHKVDVYAHAFFNGIRRFYPPESLTQDERSTTSLWFSNNGRELPNDAERFIERFLELNGLNPDSILRAYHGASFKRLIEDNLGLYCRVALSDGIPQDQSVPNQQPYFHEKVTNIDDCLQTQRDFLTINWRTTAEKIFAKLTAPVLDRSAQSSDEWQNTRRTLVERLGNMIENQTDVWNILNALKSKEKSDKIGSKAEENLNTLLRRIAKIEKLVKEIPDGLRQQMGQEASGKVEDIKRSVSTARDKTKAIMDQLHDDQSDSKTTIQDNLNEMRNALQAARSSLEEMLMELRKDSKSVRDDLKNELKFRQTQLSGNYTGAKSPFVKYPHLWLWERKLQHLRERLRFSIVSLFETAYPDVPNPDRIKAEFSKDDSIMQVLVYEWLRELWVMAYDQGMLTAGIEDNHDRHIKSLRVLLNLLLDRHPYISAPSRTYLIDGITPKACGKSANSCLVNGSVYDWIGTVLSNQKLMDELQANLLATLYQPLWQALGKLEKIERHPVPFIALDREHYQSFAHWAKPHVQRGIQIMEVLPASRDDLVSMSINEGGAVATLAAQGEGSAAYDINYLRSAAKLADDATDAFTKTMNKKTETKTESLSPTDAQESKNERIAEAESLRESMSFKEAAESFGYGAGASAKGSVFARAKSMLAYSKRREYLDAAITASGRGDNFAKWVVRPSDFRSDLVSSSLVGPGKLVAAAHNGFPNGDQPFHMLVKIPLKAEQADWDGGRYINFNSSYTATKRLSWYKTVGFPAWIGKGLFSLVNPTWWTTFEESIVGTTYPFKWDAKSKTDQEKLLESANILGGRITLDETDKIRYSDVQSLLESEASFIKATRSLQGKELSDIMGGLEAQEKSFRKETNAYLENRRKEQRQNLQKEKAEAAKGKNPGSQKQTESSGSSAQ